MENIEIFIRSMDEADIARVASLSSQLGYPSSIEEIKNRWLRISASNSEIVFVLTLAKKEVIGFAHIGIELGLTSPSRAILRSLVVDQNWRSKGLGAKFVLKVEEEMKSRGFSKIRVGSQVKRSDAHRFYQRTGYVLLKVWNVFEKELV